ncbi:MAG: alpha-ketoacid dehydrogenase subunit beta [Alphaproteobacteria bacterium]|nr:alpha-ketoacid dehydrogenase subunit beta [Alphaproteobacteria bacterium]MDP6518228.1 alpha-ketoacid dehydrogenase subunit beta [Alphaproteobacteria bacterium]
MRTATISEAMNEALREEMTRDERVFVIGEDIGHFGGTFDVTKGLLAEFGRQRIVSTPVSENAIVGVGVGAALAGMRPIAEIMFCDFMTCAIDQTINFAALSTYAAGGKVRLPLVIRTTTGHHGGAQHSKSLEAWITHVPGVKVVFPTTSYDAKGLLKTAIRDDNPVMIFESRHLYLDAGPVPEDEYFVPIGAADIKREGTDLTIVTYGLMVAQALRAATDLAGEGIDTEIVDLRTLAPLDMECVLESVAKTGQLLIVHDAWRNCGLGAEIVAQVYEQMHGSLRQPIRRLAHVDVPHPYSPVLEDAVRPSQEKIFRTVRNMLGSNQARDAIAE